MIRYLVVTLLLATGHGVQGHGLRHFKGESSGSCSSINLVTRAQWKARPPKHTVNISVPVQEFFVHHTAGTECFNQADCSAVVRGIQNFHMNERGWDDIGYSFLVGEDGNVYEGRGWKYVGAHTLGYNRKSFGTSVIGNYTDKLPNAEALAALKAVIACGIELWKITADYTVSGHRDVEKTDCPGDYLYKEIQTWPHYSSSPTKLFYLKEGDGI